MSPQELHKARRFISNLRYIDPHDSAEKTNNESNMIFNELEIRNEPLKWLKYELLFQLNLLPKKEIRNVRRFKMTDLKLAYHACLDDFRQYRGIPTLIIIKIIFMDRAGQLPNYNLDSIDRVEEAFSNIVRLYGKDHSCEIWFCRSLGLKLSGRMTFFETSLMASDLLEIVWQTGPRALEHLSLDKFEYPYLRAERPAGSMGFRIQKVYLPSSSSGIPPSTPAALLRDFRDVLGQFWWHRESIDILRAVLNAAGAKEVVLEFKETASHFAFIDWDTEIEQC